jgi:hypothetical protein
MVLSSRSDVVKKLRSSISETFFFFVPESSTVRGADNKDSLRRLWLPPERVCAAGDAGDTGDTTGRGDC